MTPTQIRDLRQRLAARLSALIRNPVIEQKELAAFDLIMSRREFLEASQLAGLGALVLAGVPPTVWAQTRQDPALKVCPQDVGLTDAEQSSVSVAAGLVTGTEVFHDSTYAKPVVAADQVGKHGVIEGFRTRPRIQSKLLSDSPDELGFLESQHQYHFGLPELIQVEGNPDPTYNTKYVVHYRHPHEALTDGARTDGLVRDYIMEIPVGPGVPNGDVLAVTGGNTNRFETDGSGNQVNSAKYMLYLDGPSPAATYIVVGYGTVSLSAPYDQQPENPNIVGWNHANPYNLLAGLYTFIVGNPLLVDTLSGSAWQSPANGVAPEFVPEQQAQHIVMTYDIGYFIFTLRDPSPHDDPSVLVTVVPRPPGTNGLDLRVVHIDYDPTSPYEASLVNVVLAGTEMLANGDMKYHLYVINSAGNIEVSADLSAYFDDPAGPPVSARGDKLNTNFGYRVKTIPAAALNNGEFQLDYSTIRNVKGLHTTIVDGNWYHIKLARFGSRGVCLFGITKEGPPEEVKSFLAFFPGGHFPLAVPDAAGLGTITHLSGGTNKFGAFRFMACDSDSNLFLFRQRTQADPSTPPTPYEGPIYAQYSPTGGAQTQWYQQPQPLPSKTSQSSNLQDLQAWVDASGAQGLEYVYNFLADAALAFATDETAVSQAVWLGNTYQAAYALDRFSLDSDHIAVQQAPDSTDTYAAYAVFKEPVTRTWRKRFIAAQVDPQGPGMQVHGDHYQAVVTPANAYGQPVSLLAKKNQGLLIEVRADSPCMVIDDTNNLYYDVDRYTSFMAAPDPGTGHLTLLVKADVFSQVLYLRLIDPNSLEPSDDDAAMLHSTAETEYAWQSVNMALQAQQRMANDGSTTGLATAPADTTIYVSSDTLAKSNDATPWQAKAGYSPVMESNLGPVATYLHTSGQNLIAASGELSLGAPNADGAIDPLYAVTVIPTEGSLQAGMTTTTTVFGYQAGSVTSSTSVSSFQPPGAPGSIWSSISHAIHDALHWLQNVKASAYKALGEGAVTMVTEADKLSVTISKEIMVQVNGLDNDVTEVMTTVEEYASVVVNVIVTIVEQSFIYQFVEILIALISLFLYFEDIKKLSDSLATFFDDLFTGNGAISLPHPSIKSSSQVSQYFGSDESTSALEGVDSGSVYQTIETTILDGITANPLSKKILNKAVSLITKLVDEASPPLPFSFDLDDGAAQTAISQLESLTGNLKKAIVTLIKDADAVGQIVADITAELADPRTAYQTLAMDIGEIFADIEADLLDDLFGLVDDITKDGPLLAHELITSAPYLTIDTIALSDLCKVFGLGDVVGSKLQLSASDAIFFPIALIAWVAIFLKKGTSTTDVSELMGDLPSTDGELGSVDKTDWNYIRIAVDTVLQELIGFVWVLNVSVSTTTELSPPLQTFVQCGSWFALARWVNDFAYSTYNFVQSSPGLVQDYDYGNAAFRLYTAALDAVLTLPGKKYNEGGGWAADDPRPTDITQLMNAVVTGGGALCVDTVNAVVQGLDFDSTLFIVGQDIFRLQPLLLFLYNALSPNSEEYIEAFLAGIVATPVLGGGLQVDGLLGENSASEPSSGPAQSCSGGRGSGHGKKTKRRPHG